MHLRAISESAALATDGNFLKTQVLGSISEMPVSHLVITVVYFTNSTSVSISVVIKYADKSNLKGECVVLAHSSRPSRRGVKGEAA